MQKHQQTPVDVGVSHSGHRPSPEAVAATLESILQSQPFRTSRQCQNLLSYIVRHSLHDDDASLRERILGVEVFGRSVDYDTSEDPVVRMRAADVRKRLAQFYQASGDEVPVVYISLKPGSYRATFHDKYASRQGHHLDAPPVAATTPEAVATLVSDNVIDSTTPAPLPRPEIRRWLFHPVVLVFTLILASLLGLAAWKTWKARSVTAQQRFWSPVTRADQPILLYVGSNAVYRFTPDYLTRYRKEHGVTQNGPEFFVDLPKGKMIRADDLVEVKDSFVALADLAATIQVISLMHAWSKPFTMRSAADLSMGDIRNVPAVLIGGFNNPWALRASSGLPFSFRDGVKIENRNDPTHSWEIRPESGTSATQDFALISRLQHSDTGGPVLMVGGIGSFGTQAAAEFVANPDRMNDLLKSAPAGWEDKNMQAVLQIKVVNYAPVAVNVVAVSYW